MRMAGALAALAVLSGVGCTDSTEPAALTGTWGGPEATLTLTMAGGTVEYACGSGTIDSGWRLDADGTWRASGQYFAGGGPLPSEGRPPHPATYAGRVQGELLTFTVKIGDLATSLGPFTVRRNAPGASEMCV
jgi:hypothetical protein